MLSKKVSELKEGVFLPRPDLYEIVDDAEKDVERFTEDVEVEQRTPSEGEKGITEISEFEQLDEYFPVHLDPVTKKLLISANPC